MINDKKIKETVAAIKAAADEFLKYTDGLNPCAYSDRMVESIISKAARLKKLYDGNVPENTSLNMLTMTFPDDGVVGYETDCKKALPAYEKFVETAVSAGINAASGHKPLHLTLTSSEGVVLDECDMPETDLDKAKRLINTFCMWEYLNPANFTDLSRVGVAYTEYEETPDGDPIIPPTTVEAYVDLVNCRLVILHDGKEHEVNSYGSLSELIDNELRWLDCDSLVEYDFGEGEAKESSRRTINRYELEPLHLPVDGYRFVVKTITSIDGGKNFYYCGNSRYFRTEAEAKAYKAEQEATDKILAADSLVNNTTDNS